MTGNQVSLWIAGLGVWPLIVVLIPNLFFRRYGRGGGPKRMASLYQAIATFAITTAAAFIAERRLTDLYLYIAVAAVAVTLIIFRSRVFPYRRTCPGCGTRLDIQTIYFIDSHLCPACRDKAPG